MTRSKWKTNRNNENSDLMFIIFERCFFNLSAPKRISIWRVRWRWQLFFCLNLVNLITMLREMLTFFYGRWNFSRWFMAPHGDSNEEYFDEGEKKSVADRKIDSLWFSISWRFLLTVDVSKLILCMRTMCLIIDE